MSDIKILKDEAANTLGLNQSSISSVCNKPNRTYNNYKWEKIN
jgi:hypothetical protein